MDREKPERETLILERILTLKQFVKDGTAGSVEFHELGICYFLLGNYKQAIGFLDRIVEQGNNYLEIAAVYALRIYCLLMDNQYEEALKSITERLRIYPNDLRLLSFLAHIHEKKSDHLNAIALHRKILELDAHNVNSLNNLGYLLTLFGSDQEQAEAMRVIKRAMEIKPDYPAYLDTFGVFLAKRGNKESARKALTRALQRAPGNPVIMDHLKDILEISRA